MLGDSRDKQSQNLLAGQLADMPTRRTVSSEATFARWMQSTLA